MDPWAPRPFHSSPPPPPGRAHLATRWQTAAGVSRCSLALAKRWRRHGRLGETLMPERVCCRCLPWKPQRLTCWDLLVAPQPGHYLRAEELWQLTCICAGAGACVRTLSHDRPAAVESAWQRLVFMILCPVQCMLLKKTNHPRCHGASALCTTVALGNKMPLRLVRS